MMHIAITSTRHLAWYVVSARVYCNCYVNLGSYGAGVWLTGEFTISFLQQSPEEHLRILVRLESARPV